ncbi:MAG: prepilin-type N-terminal cleavage/methylation domain-containing protein [Candidatus Riflebacteria bacterium]|nr:prepilin-type N-terminal cleavage/methylation domain-containing protein [Candidatus Riflebacteria bacterium]
MFCMKLYKNPVRRGFTLVEVTMAILISGILFAVIQTLFSRTMTSTMKGQDNLDTMRAGMRFFSDFRRDLLAAVSVSIPDIASFSVSDAQNLLSASTLPFSGEIDLINNAQKVTYRYLSGERGIYREVSPKQGKDYVFDPAATQLYGIPRITEFTIQHFWLPQKIDGNIQWQDNILLKVILDSENPRFPTKRQVISSIFAGKSGNSDLWNNE